MRVYLINKLCVKGVAFIILRERFFFPLRIFRYVSPNIRMTFDENDGALTSAAPPKVAALLTFTNVHATTSTNTTNTFSKRGEEEDSIDDEIERVLNARGVKRSSFFEIEKNGAEENIEDVSSSSSKKPSGCAVEEESI